MDELGEVIAVRRLKIVGEPRRRVEIRIGRPRRAGQDWACPIQLQGLGGGSVQLVYGIDGLQALDLAIEAARVLLERSAERFSWLGEEGTGIPRTIPDSLGHEFTLRLHGIVDQAIEDHVRTSEREAEQG